MPRFKLLAGKQDWTDDRGVTTAIKAGDIITSRHPLHTMFRNKFELVVSPAPEADDSSGSSPPVEFHGEDVTDKFPIVPKGHTVHRTDEGYYVYHDGDVVAPGLLDDPKSVRRLLKQIAGE